MHIGSLIIVCGGSGTGKSSLATQLQELLLPDAWLHFSIDTILYCLAESTLAKANQHNDWSSIDGKSIMRSSYACLRCLLEQGNRVIFDCVISTERGASDLLLALNDYDPIVVGLTCALDETKRRTIARGDRTLAEAEHGHKTANLYFSSDFTLDTSDRSATDLAADLIRAISGYSGPQAWKQNRARYQSA